MLKRLAFLLALFALPAHASIHGSAGALPTCVYGSSLPDGCPGAPANGHFSAATYYATPTWYAHAAASGQTWTSAHPWTWNAAAVDYAIGYSTSVPLHDVADVTSFTATITTSGAMTVSGQGGQSNIQVGQTIDTQSISGSTTLPANTKVISGSGSSWQLSAGPPSTTITGAALQSQWTPSGCRYSATGSAFSTPNVYCTHYNNAVLGSVTVGSVAYALDFSGVTLGEGCTILEFSGGGTTSANTYEVLNGNFKGGQGGNCDQTNGYLIKVDAGTAAFTLLDDQIDENSTAGGRNLLATVVDNASTGAGQLTVEYTAIVNASARPIAVGTNFTGDVLMKWNYFDGWVMRSNQTTGTTSEHGEVLEMSNTATATINNINYLYNTANSPATQPGATGTTVFYLNGQTGQSVTITNSTIDHNVVGSSCAGGNCATASNIAGSISGTTVTVSPGYTGTIVAGQVMNNAPLGDTCSLTAYTGSSGAGGTGTCAGSPVAGSFTTASTLSDVVSSGLMQFTRAINTNSTITNNYLDWTGATTCAANAAPPATLTNAPTMSGNVSLTSGNSILRSASDIGVLIGNAGCN